MPVFYAQSYDGIDIIFVVDQSGSMGGEAFGQPDRTATDPLSLRFESVAFAIDLLDTYRQILTGDLPIRMAVVNFGDSAEVTLNWTEIAPSGDPDWNTTKQQLQTAVSAETFKRTYPPGNLGNTDFVSAFQRADQLFDALGSNTHLHVVIAITDGEACVVNGPGAFECGRDPEGGQAHMEALYALTEAQFPADDYLLYVIALDDTGSLWPTSQADWERIVRDANHATQVENGTQIAVQIQNILVDILAQVRTDVSLIPPTALTVGANNLEIPPYQRELRLTFFKQLSQPIIAAVTTPDGRTLTPGAQEIEIVNADQPIEIWTITDPLPGIWTIELQSQDSLIEAFWQVQPIPLRMTISPVAAKLFQTTELSVQLQPQDGGVIPNYNGSYPLTVTTEIEQPDRSIVIVPLATVAQGDYNGTFQIDQIGVYNLDFHADTQNLDGTSLLLASNNATFTIGDTVFTAADLPSGEYLEGSIYTTEVTLLEPDGSPLTLPNLSVTMVLEDTSGTVVQSEILSDENGDGIYPTRVELQTAGEYRLFFRAASQPDGMSAQEIGVVVSTPFTVLASVQIDITIVTPQDNAQSYLTGGFPSFEPTPLIVQVATTTLTDNQRINIRQISSAVDPILKIALLQDGETRFETTDAIYSADGLYETQFEDVPAGRYTLRVSVLGNLGGRYVARGGGTVSLMVDRVMNPEQLLFLIGVIGLMAFVLLSGVFIGLRWYRRRQHPLRGSLILRRQSGFDEPFEVWTARLGDYNRNYIRFNASNLHMRKNDVIRWITFSTSSEKMSQQKQMDVRVKLKSGRVLETRLSPGVVYSINADQSYAEGSEAMPVYHLEQKADFGISVENGDFGNIFFG